MPADKRVTRAVYGVYIVITAAFVVSCIVQVSTALFGSRGQIDRPQGASAACAAALRELAAAVDRGVTAGAGSPTAEEAERRYREATAPVWNGKGELLRPCHDDPAGPDALSAIVRLDQTATHAVRRQSSELGPVRREVDSFIR